MQIQSHTEVKITRDSTETIINKVKIIALSWDRALSLKVNRAHFQSTFKHTGEKGLTFASQNENLRVKWLFLLQARFLDILLIKSLIPIILIVLARETKSDKDPHHILYFGDKNICSQS